MLANSTTGHAKDRFQICQTSVECPIVAASVRLGALTTPGVSTMSPKPEVIVAHVALSNKVTARFETLGTGSARVPSNLLPRHRQVHLDRT